MAMTAKNLQNVTCCAQSPLPRKAQWGQELAKTFKGRTGPEVASWLGDQAHGMAKEQDFLKGLLCPLAP